MLAIRHILLPTLAAVIAVSSCAGQGSGTAPGLPAEPGVLEQPAGHSDSFWTSALPLDSAQPWEELNSSGQAVPRSGRSASALNQDSEFVAGIERFLEGGSAADNGEATMLSSAPGSLSYAVYRIPLGGAEPGVVSVDANLTAGAGYYIGLADYGRDAWQWHGPFSDNHVRISTARAGIDLTSALGSVFVCVVAPDGAACDVVGIGLNVVDTSDDAAPPAPAAPVLTPVGHGLEVEWLPVIAGDLAGFRIYYSSQWFFDGQGTGVRAVEYLEGLTSHMLTGLQGETFVRVSAVDMSGNESAPSNVASAEPLAGAAKPLTVAVSAPSGKLNEPITVTATGAYSYDFDIDGDGTYDITGSASGSAAIDTSSLGIIRATVRGRSSSGTSFARGGVSIVIAGNSRPAAAATASPQSGVAPLIVNFTGLGEDQEDDAGALAYAWDFDGDGIYEPDTNQLVLANEYTVPGVYGVKFRVTDTDGAWDVDTIPVLVTGVDPLNMPPTAELSATPVAGNAPLQVEFDASGSSDSDGMITGYEWDFNGDGLYDSYGTASMASFSYSSAGTFTAEVRVTDNGGATDSATLVVTSRLGTWSPQTAATGVNVGQHTSLAIVDGNPAISYHDVLNFELNYVRATDAAGDNWGVPVVVDDSPLVGEHTSLAVVDGNPAISYYDNNNDNLNYVRATDAQGGTWGEPVAVDTADDVGRYTSLAVVEGNPAISYFDDTFDDLKFVRATDATGSAWGLPLRIDNTGDVGSHTSLAIVDGKPAVSYFDIGGGNLKFVRAAEADGSVWFSPITLDSLGVAGFFNSLAVVNGNPAVAYYNESFAEILYIRATDATGIDWGTPVKINQTDASGHPSLAVVDGRPAVGYFGGANDLFFVQANDAEGAGWETPVTVDTLGIVGRFTSMVMVKGSPAISYYDETQHNLKYARLE